jgi:hypothetical protein
VQVSEKLGVKSLRRMMLADSADTVSLGLHSVEAFGQSEFTFTHWYLHLSCWRTIRVDMEISDEACPSEAHVTQVRR